MSEKGRREERPSSETHLFCPFIFADEYITMKQLAAVRFHRNHRLMAEIFNDIVVPTSRSGERNAVTVGVVIGYKSSPGCVLFF